MTSFFMFFLHVTCDMCQWSCHLANRTLWEAVKRQKKWTSQKALSRQVFGQVDAKLLAFYFVLPGLYIFKFRFWSNYSNFTRPGPPNGG